MKNSAILLIDCPDQKGLVAAVSTFLYQHGANILHCDQHQDNALGLFFMRIEWDLADFQFDREQFRASFEPIAARYRMRWRVEYSEPLPNVAIFVSRYLHCLVDLLHRHQIGELGCSTPIVISNHEDARELAAFHRVPFFHLPVTPASKQEAEARQLEILAAHKIDLIVLARYMQVLSPNFVERHKGRIINVHHSFLPAF